MSEPRSGEWRCPECGGAETWEPFGPGRGLACRRCLPPPPAGNLPAVRP
ncbi:MAG: hypothetical protein WC789_09370 [Lentisphaeria bacterium]